MEQDADAFVLVIGGRYGSVVPAVGKSVTNLEYRMARAKGIPVFAFARGEVLAALPIWRDNQQADFKAIVTDPGVFEFIDEVRGKHSVWMQEFRVARDITNALRQQFAYRMMDGLHLQRQLHGSPADYARFSGAALRIVLERPLAWEHLLLAQLVEDEVASAADLRLSYDTHVSFGPGERVLDDDTPAWQSSVLAQSSGLINGLSRLLTETLNESLLAGDTAQIGSCARLVGRAYREAMEWAIGVRRAHVSEDRRPVVHEMSLFTRDIIVEIEALPEGLRRTVHETVAGIGPDEKRSASFNFNVNIHNLEAYEKAFEVLRRKRQPPGK